jgi:hypothetical protein
MCVTDARRGRTWCASEEYWVREERRASGVWITKSSVKSAGS